MWVHKDEGSKQEAKMVRLESWALKVVRQPKKKNLFLIVLASMRSYFLKMRIDSKAPPIPHVMLLNPIVNP